MPPFYDRDFAFVPFTAQSYSNGRGTSRRGYFIFGVRVAVIHHRFADK